MKRQGRQITEEELAQIQAIETELIAELDRICKKNHIHYNMVGGTMLGAIRHKGHIPWDDDADIGFLRKEYEKFRNACKTDLDHARFSFQDFRDTPGYRWGYGKLRRKDTEFLRLGQEDMPYEQGIFIDLMPFDNVPDGWIGRRIHFAVCFIYRKLLWSIVGSKTEKNPAKKMIYIVTSKVPERVIKQSYERFIRRSNRGRNGRTSELVRILTFPTPKHCFGYRREWYTRLARYPFGELTLPGARDYDGYLTAKYGQYRELPPQEKRKIHPISRLTLQDTR